MCKVNVIVVDGAVHVEDVLAEVCSGEEEAGVQVLRCATEEELRGAVQQLLTEAREEVPRFSIKTRSGVLLLAYSDILYCRTQGHRVLVYLVNGGCVSSVTMRESFAKVAAPLLEYGFLQPQRGNVVNPGYIIQFTRTELRLTNGDMLPISRSVRAEVLGKLTAPVR